MVGKSLGHYGELREIGAGGMGRVYRALDTRLGREVALKILPPELAGDAERLRRFENEARSLAALNHPGIVTVYSVEETDGVRFLTMEYVPGDPLTAAVGADGIPLPRLYRIGQKLADALAAAHDKGIVHRDLKPANIILTPEGSPKVLDFGLARNASTSRPRADTDSSRDTVSDLGVAVGTLPYMSPEQVHGDPGDHRSDIFAFGILLYEMATGHRPFQGETAATLAASILRDDPPPVTETRSEAPDRLARLIEHCLEKSPDFRPSSMAALRDELGSIAHDHAEPRVPSIAVLPFADMSPEKDQEYFCDGIAEELITGLAGLKNLRVASRTSTFLFKNAALDIREIGRQLHVETILEGSVRKADRRLRVTAQLIDVRTGYHLWSERFDREIEDVFAIQDEIARSIVRALEVTLSPGESASPEGPPTRDVQAYDYYLRGRSFYYQFRRQGIERALTMFSLAIRHDPDYARAYAGIADSCAFLVLYADRSEEALRRAEEASAKALALGPDLAETHASRGLVLSLGGRHREAEAEFEAAVRLGPRHFETWYYHARDSFAQGKLEEAARLFEKASALHPADYQSPLLVAQIYDSLSLPDRAAAARRRGVAVVEKRLRVHPDDVRALYMGANGLVALGEREKGREWADLAREMDPDEPMVLYNVGCIYSLLGLDDDALDCLERAARTGLKQKGWYENDSNLDPVRGHERFAALMRWLDENPPTEVRP